MSKRLQISLKEIGIPLDLIPKVTSVLLQAIESELAHEGKFVLRGLGRLEVVRSQRRSPASMAAIARGNSKPAQPLPVRVRFQISREFKKKMATAYEL